MKLTELLRTLFLTLLLAVGGVSLTACASDGPFEEAGEEIDEGVEEIDEEIDELEDDIDD